MPALSQRRGFSSSRVEHLLNQLVAWMPADEMYLEVGVLDGRTLESAGMGNANKRLVGCDPGDKYGGHPSGFDPHISFVAKRWQELTTLDIRCPVGLAFYDGDHSKLSTREFMVEMKEWADEAVTVLDDWDRVTVREGAFEAARLDPGWQLLREMPEYTDGLTTAPHHFGYQFGVSVWGWRRGN